MVMWSFSVSVFQTLGSEEAVTGLKGSSGITLEQDVEEIAANQESELG